MSAAWPLRRRTAIWLHLPVALLAIAIAAGCGDRLAGGGGVETGNGQVEVVARLLLPDGSPAAGATAELVQPVIDGSSDSAKVLATSVAGRDGMIRIRCALARPVFRARLGAARILRSFAADSGPAASTLVLHPSVALVGSVRPARGAMFVCVPGAGACAPVGSDGRWRLDSIPQGVLEIAVLGAGRVFALPARLAAPDTLVDAGEILLPDTGKTWMPWQSPLRPGPVPLLVFPPPSIEVLDPFGRRLVRSDSAGVLLRIDLPRGIAVGAVVPVALDAVAGLPDPPAPAIVAQSPTGAVLRCAREGGVLWVAIDSASHAASGITLVPGGAMPASPWDVASAWRRMYHLSDSGLGSLSDAVSGVSASLAWANGDPVQLAGIRLSGRSGRGLALLPGMIARFPLWGPGEGASLALAFSFRPASIRGMLFEAWETLRVRADSVDIHAEALVGGSWAPMARWRLPAPLAPGAWHDLAFRLDAGGASLVLDGRGLVPVETCILVADRASAGALVVSGDALSALDEVRLGASELWPRIGWNTGTIAAD